MGGSCDSGGGVCVDGREHAVVLGHLYFSCWKVIASLCWFIGESQLNSTVYNSYLLYHLAGLLCRNYPEYPFQAVVY